MGWDTTQRRAYDLHDQHQHALGTRHQKTQKPNNLLSSFALISVMSVTHFFKGAAAVKSRFRRSSDLRASRSALVIPLDFRFGLWIRFIRSITLRTVASHGILIPYCAAETQIYFSSDCIEFLKAYCRMVRKLFVIWRKIWSLWRAKSFDVLCAVP